MSFGENGRVERSVPADPSEPARAPLAAATYRSDIDGLRALAVLPVVAFHAGFPVLTGGFLGVDIFFVISGFLITGIIYREIEAGTFSLWRFYERRVRRIFPALLVVIAATLAVGWLILLPAELKELGESAIASSLSLANLFFYFTTDYFAEGVKPLLHIWSLAVEEQFYLFFPLILLFLHRRAPRILRHCVVAGAVLSLVLAEVYARTSPSAAFYGPQFRAWELMMGGMLAIFRPAVPVSALVRNAISVIGVALILGSMVIVNKSMTFPGLSAFPACLGATMILYAGGNARSNIVSWGLSLPPVRFIGLISYSLYLWHWPIIVYVKESAAHVSFQIPQDNLGKCLIVLASIIAATLSWWFVERPFRRARSGTTARRVVGYGAAAAVAVCAVAAVPVVGRGFPSRYPAQAQKIIAYLDYPSKAQFRSGTCFIDSNYASDAYRRDICLARKAGVPNVMIIGDSYAAQLWWGLSHDLPGANVAQVTASGCRPTINQRVTAARRCIEMMNFAFGDGIRQFRPDAIILAGNWLTKDKADIAATVAFLKTKTPHLVLVGAMPHYDAAVPKLLAVAVMRNDPSHVDRHRLAWIGPMDVDLRAIAAANGVPYLSGYATLCRAGRCQVTFANGAPLQFDSGHFTADGSAYLVRRWMAENPAAFAY